MDNKSNLVPAGASQAAGHRGRHRRQPCLPRAGGGCGYDSHGFPAQHCYAPLLGVCALVLYAGPQAPAASLLATAHGRLLLARTSRAHCWSKYSGHKPPNPNPSHQWSLHISRSLLNQASVELWRHRCREFKISPLSVAAAAAKHDLTATALPSFGCREPLSTIHVTVPKLGKDVVTATAPLQARPPWPPPR
jgi:hypothetical protein